MIGMFLKNWRQSGAFRAMVVAIAFVLLMLVVAQCARASVVPEFTPTNVEHTASAGIVDRLDGGAANTSRGADEFAPSVEHASSSGIINRSDGGAANASRITDDFVPSIAPRQICSARASTACLKWAEARPRKHDGDRSLDPFALRASFLGDDRSHQIDT